MSAAIVDIADVYPGAVKVLVESLRVGDLVFDITGGTHELKRVKVYKHRVHTWREDGWRDMWNAGETITIWREVTDDGSTAG